MGEWYGYIVGVLMMIVYFGVGGWKREGLLFSVFIAFNLGSF